MARVTFTRDYNHPIDALSHARYLADRTYSVGPDIEAAGRAAGAIKEKSRGRSGRRAGKGGAVASEE